jgi:endonuclease/exonuclease/phosphatase family metal-dependent hydrolase
MTVEISVLTYNIHKGFSMGGRQFVLQRMREALPETRADVVFLQEALGQHSAHAQNHAGWPEDSQFEYLADTLWPHHSYGRNAIYE